MKINQINLPKIFRELINSNKPTSRHDCPDPKTLLAFYQGKLSKRKTKKISNHLIHCSGCLEELDLIRSIKREENFLIDKILEIKGNPKEKSSFALKWALKPVPALLIFSTALIIILIMIFNPFNKEIYRGGENFIASLPSPKYLTAPKPTLIFKWPELENAQSYYFEIFDETLFPLWRAGPLTTNRIIIPSEILQKIEANQRYFWVVSAQLKDGTRIESPLTPFKLKTSN